MDARLERARRAGRGEAVVEKRVGIFGSGVVPGEPAVLASFGARGVAVDQRDMVAEARVEPQRRLVDQRTGCHAAQCKIRADRRVDAEHLADAHETDVTRPLHDQAIDVVFAESAVVERVAQRPHRERVLIEIRKRALRSCADADDRRLVAQTLKPLYLRLHRFSPA